MCVYLYIKKAHICIHTQDIGSVQNVMPNQFAATFHYVDGLAQRSCLYTWVNNHIATVLGL